MEKTRKPRRAANGDGSIYQETATGKWAAALSIGYTAQGNIKRKVFRGDTRDEVRRQLTAAVRQRDQGAALSSGSWTVGKWVEEYQLRHKESVRPSTANLESTMAAKWILPSIGKRSLVRLTPSDVAAWQRELAKHLSSGTANIVRTYLGSALKAAMREGLIARDVMTLVPRLRVESRPHTIWDEKQARAFLASVQGNPLECLFLFAVVLGIRHGELLGLRLEDVAGDTLSIRRQRYKGKTVPLKRDSSRRVLTLPALAADALRAHLEARAHHAWLMASAWKEQGWLFTGARGGPLGATKLNDHWREATKTSGLPPIRFHDLRHTAASVLLACGVPLKAIQGMLGHASMSTTANTYAHLLPAVSRATADAAQAAFGRVSEPTAISTATPLLVIRRK